MKTPDEDESLDGTLDALFEAHRDDETLRSPAAARLHATLIATAPVPAPASRPLLAFGLAAAGLLALGLGAYALKTSSPSATNEELGAHDEGIQTTLVLREVIALPDGTNLALVETGGFGTLRLVAEGDKAGGLTIDTVRAGALTARGTGGDERTSVAAFPRGISTNTKALAPLLAAWRGGRMDAATQNALNDFALQGDPIALAFMNTSGTEIASKRPALLGAKGSRDEQAYFNLLSIAGDASHPGRIHALRSLAHVDSPWTLLALRAVAADPAAADAARLQALRGLAVLHDGGAGALLNMLSEDSGLSETLRGEVAATLRAVTK